jgi:endonuclease/exonuclease/phosphatase family metal-dependent hydrolase
MHRLMKHFPMIAILVTGVFLLVGCGGKDTFVVPGNPFEGAETGTDETLEVLTWNLENFAKKGDTTVDLLIQAIDALDVDLIALQEIEDGGAFRDLHTGLDGWTGIKASSAYADLDLAFMYRTDGPIEAIPPYEILTREDALPRSPFVLEFTFNGVPMVLINNHFKAMADEQSESRRRAGCLLLEEYVEDHFAGRKVIIVGDMNDELTDPPADNVFANFLDDADHWKFVDLPIAEDSAAQWSYPGWPSHIDHILINEHLFAESVGAGSEVRVLPIHSYMSNFSAYDLNISDHLPVMFQFEPIPAEVILGPNPFEDGSVGTDSTLEVVTWNLEHFAKNGSTTVTYAAQAIVAMDADIVALQEIEDTTRFADLLAAMDGWSGVKANSAYYDADLAFVYKTGGSLVVDTPYEILIGEGALPRRPFVLECTYDGVPVVVINNHFKCCGDGEIYVDEWDEEYRRQQASLLLENYIDANFAGVRVILVGDLNDELTDPTADNVFANFLGDPAHWRFVDLPIAQDSDELWSYPSWPSHIDHILISDELFTAHAAPEAGVGVVPLHDLLGGWSAYDSSVSDHLPLAFRCSL